MSQCLWSALKMKSVKYSISLWKHSWGTSSSQPSNSNKMSFYNGLVMLVVECGRGQSISVHKQWHQEMHFLFMNFGKPDPFHLITKSKIRKGEKERERERRKYVLWANVRCRAMFHINPGFLFIQLISLKNTAIVHPLFLWPVLFLREAQCYG